MVRWFSLETSGIRSSLVCALTHHVKRCRTPFCRKVSSQLICLHWNVEKFTQWFSNLVNESQIAGRSEFDFQTHTPEFSSEQFVQIFCWSLVAAIGNELRKYCLQFWIKNTDKNKMGKHNFFRIKRKCFRLMTEYTV